ncbi:OmpA family protein [Chitinophaga horti]|uniref:OmpA family protein n=1 Tax=Chitinophaga horti TaxID=2920382 RepID=A0ABY6IVD3_9BACT|nr:OmpA family protein [Chitinophaga horti]UYQ91332.1 OmpA family protein [Chitinophaga horti]
MKRKFLAMAALCIAALAPVHVFAQDEPMSATDNTVTTTPAGLFKGTEGYRKWSIGINAGLLAPVAFTGGHNDFTKWLVSYGYGGYVKWQVLHMLSLRADFLGGQLKANNEKKLGNGSTSSSPYNQFETMLQWSGSLNAVFNVANMNFFAKRNFMQLYVSAGGGLAGYKPTLTTNGNVTFDYKPDGSIKEFYVPVGAGLKFKLSESANFDIGYTMHYLDGDNLDGVVNSSGRDKFSYGYIGVEFPLGRKTKPQLAWHNPIAEMYDDLAAQRDQVRLELDAQKEANAKLAADFAKLTADSDKDGVSDQFDKCPNTPADVKVDGSGCPLPRDTVAPKEVKIFVTEADNRLVREAIANLEFETGKASIKPSSFPSLDRVAELLVKKGFSIKLSGHTDNVGRDDSNMILSKQRAEAVKAYLVQRNVNASKVEAVGYGETQPIASNKTAAGRQQNRRVEFVLY